MGIFRTPDELTFDYYDVSDDPEAWSYTALDADEESALVAAGFSQLGVAHSVLRANGRSLVDQVWVGDGGRVMTTAFAFTTLFEDGTIVRTMRPPRGSFFMAARWHLRMHPADRYPLTFVDGPFVAALVSHREHVAAVEKNTPVVVASSMTEYFGTRLRGAELRLARQSRHGVHVLWLTCILSAIAAMVPAWHLHALGRPATTSLVLGMIAFACATLPLAWATNMWVAPWIIRLRPGPPPRPASEWIELARAVPSRRFT